MNNEFGFGNLLKDAEPTDFFKKVKEAIQERHTNQLIDPYFLRQSRDWARLANQVVGAENPKE